VSLRVTGLFFGTLPTILAVLTTGAFRLATGTWVGIAVITTSGGTGLIWRHRRRKLGILKK